MIYYIYKELNKDVNHKKNESSQMPIYAWKEPPSDKLGDEQKEDAHKKRGYEEVDFNIDSFIVDN